MGVNRNDVQTPVRPPSAKGLERRLNYISTSYYNAAVTRIQKCTAFYTGQSSIRLGNQKPPPSCSLAARLNERPPSKSPTFITSAYGRTRAIKRTVITILKNDAEKLTRSQVFLACWALDPPSNLSKRHRYGKEVVKSQDLCFMRRSCAVSSTGSSIAL
jgi:hypothetical protein